MDYSNVWAIWAVAIAGPCIISWLAGDIAGSARTRQLYGEKEAFSEADPADQHAPETSVIEAWRVPGVVHPLVEAVEGTDPAALHPPSFTEEAARAECRRLERAALSASSRSIVSDWSPQARVKKQTPDQVLRQSARSVGDQNAQSQPYRVQIVEDREVQATRPV